MNTEINVPKSALIYHILHKIASSTFSQDIKIEKKYEERISFLEKEINFLRKIISTLQKTVEKFIHWVCCKFSVSEEDEFVRDFEFENDTYINPVKQIEYEQELEYKDLEL